MSGTGRDGLAADGSGADASDALESRAADFWGDVIPVPLAPDAPLVPDPAIAALMVPDLAIRGRNPADLLRPAYDSLTSR